MTHDDITLAIRMIARGQINHEAVQALAAGLARALEPAPEAPAAVETNNTPAPKSDSIPLSRPKKR